jgi:OOP family OmpA-OmpF porin
MRYSIAAVGAGGSQTASTAVTVTPPPPKVVDRLTVRVNFDLDKAIIRSADEAELQRAVAFVKKYPGSKLSIEGHTDSLASEEYNQGLSLRRATAVRDYFVKGGVADISRMTVVGRGESMPIADNGTPEGRFQNRRVEILILSE